MPIQHLATEKVTLTADDTARFWRYTEEAFREIVRELAAEKSRAIKAPVAIVGDDGMTLEVVAKYELP